MEHATSVGPLESCTPAGIRGENNDMQLTVYGIFKSIGCRPSIEWKIVSPEESTMRTSYRLLCLRQKGWDMEEEVYISEDKEIVKTDLMNVTPTLASSHLA